jgi:hypothetical protein
MRVAAETPGPFYLRIVRCEVEDNEIGPDYEFRLGKGTTVIDEGSDIGLVSTGYMIRTAKRAAQKLGDRGVGVRLDHHPSLKPFDEELLCDMAGKVKAIVTLENHCTSGGLFSLVAEAFARRGLQIPVGAIGTDPDDFIHTGHINDLLARYKMTSDDVMKRQWASWPGSWNDGAKAGMMGGLGAPPQYSIVPILRLSGLSNDNHRPLSASIHDQLFGDYMKVTSVPLSLLAGRIETPARSSAWSTGLRGSVSGPRTSAG